MNKLKIKKHFDRAYKTYDDYCHAQNEACDRALKLLTCYESQFKTIADFACGTGESTLKLIDCIQHDKCYAVDFSNKLLAAAVNKLPSAVDCILADFEECLFEKHYLDLIFCNMGLQWSCDFEKTASLFYQYLNHNGYLAFSLPVNGNFKEIKSEYKYPLLKNEQIEKHLSTNGFKVVKCCTYNQAQPFSSYHEALVSLQKVGANISFVNKAFKRMIARDFFIEECASPVLTYYIAIYICQK